MAPPTRARTGSNRKAQLGLFTGYLLAGAGTLFGGALLVISLWKPETFAPLRGTATDAVSVVGSAGAAGRVGTRGFLEAMFAYYRAGSRNAALEHEVEIARVKLVQAQAVEQENARLKALLKLGSGATMPVAYARLIGSTAASTRRFAFLSAGKSDGVTPGMPVLSPTGLVGRVLETGAHSSRVLLLTDAESLVPIRRAKDDIVAFAEGRSDGSLRIRLVNLGINPVRPGDVFVTSGAGGLYPPNVPVAIVAQLTKDGAVAQVLSNPAATDAVVVDPIWQSAAVQELARPAPNPIPAATAKPRKRRKH